MNLIMITINNAAVHEYPITRDYGIEINCTKLQDLISDFKSFEDQYLAKTGPERMEIMNLIEESIRNTTASLVFNFGTLIKPLLQNVADLT